MLDAGPGLYVATSVVALVGLTWYRRYRDNRSHPPLPPGPLALPILGSILSIHDPVRLWLTFNDWRSTYGQGSVMTVCSRLLTILLHCQVT